MVYEPVSAVQAIRPYKESACISAGFAVENTKKHYSDFTEYLNGTLESVQYTTCLSLRNSSEYEMG